MLCIHGAVNAICCAGSSGSPGGSRVWSIGAALRFGPAIIVGGAFASWGWANVGFAWGRHDIIMDYAPWSSVWINRGYYVHPYVHPWVRPVAPRVEVHRIVRRR